MTEARSDAEEPHYARVVVKRGDQRPTRERIRALMAKGVELNNLYTLITLKPEDAEGLLPRFSPSGARVYVRHGSADEIALYWPVYRHRGRMSVRPLADPVGAVHPGLVAELAYMADDIESFENIITASADAYDYVVQLEATFKSYEIEEMQVRAMAARAKQAAIDVVREINCAN